MNINEIGKRCVGCFNCLNKCPVNAISKEIDEYGHVYPKINGKCLNCSICLNFCPVYKTPTTKEPFFCGYAYALDKDIKFYGSSGGLFGVFASYYISNGGVVYGAAFDDSQKLKTTRTCSINGLSMLYKSKYILCDTTDIFKKIKKDLDEGKDVLYCSSPCQIAALKLFLKDDYNKLFCIDFVCHGVSSQSFFDKSIKDFEKDKHAVVTHFSFRDKRRRGSHHYYSIKYIDKHGKQKENIRIFYNFPFYNAYAKALSYRPNCYECKYANSNRCGDITIGDFHLISKYDKKIDKDSGVSMFTVNTQRGDELFKKLGQMMFIKQMPWEIIKENNRFGNSEKYNQTEIDDFNALIKRNNFNEIIRFLNPKKDLKYKIYYKMPSFIRKIIYRITKNRT